MQIADLLSQQRIPFKQGNHRHITHGWVGIQTCPFCTANDYHLGIHLATGRTTCWKCGSHGLAEVVQKLTNAPWHEIKKWLAGVDLRRGPVVKKTGTLQLPKGLGPLMPVHRRYLEGRGFDPDELVRLWGIQGIGLAAKLAWRIFIPVEFRGETVSWTTRATGDNAMRYVSASAAQESLSAKTLLYGAQHARHAVVICEGPTDVWRIGPGAIGTLGVGYSKAQLAAISRYPVRAVCFDAEAGAQRRARRLADDLGAYPGETVNIVLDSGDPGDASENEVRRIRKHVLGDW